MALHQANAMSYKLEDPLLQIVIVSIDWLL